jgi:HD superfamily phosphohydrolase
MNFRPKLYRDPVHGVIRYPRADMPALDGDGIGELVVRLIDTPEFQRLRHIRQNGLANYVFQGMEHSRYTHSMGVAHVAAQMYDAAIRNSGELPDEAERCRVVCAALLHDCGHGPFSHTLEEVLGKGPSSFHHEYITTRYIRDNGSSINAALAEVDSDLPEEVAAYIDPARRAGDDKWTYRLVSSQLDADRLDYAMRDALMAGLQGHGFDYPRIRDMLLAQESKLCVDCRALDAVVQYLVALDNLYRSIYYHHAVRAAACLMIGLFSRIRDLVDDGRDDVLATGSPLWGLFESGEKMPLDEYSQIGEYAIWSAVCDWQSHSDSVLARLAQSLMSRRLPKPLRVPLPADYEQKKVESLQAAIDDLARKNGFDPRYEVSWDDPQRTAYKRHNFRREEGDPDVIWIVGPDKLYPLEHFPCDTSRKDLLKALEGPHYHSRLFVPDEIRVRAEALAEKGA